LAVHLDLDFFSAMSAFGLDGKSQVLFSELPLHEGRRNRVDASGSVNFLAAAESDAVGGWLRSDGISPGHRPLLISEEESHVLFQLIPKMETTCSLPIFRL